MMDIHHPWTRYEVARLRDEERLLRARAAMQAFMDEHPRGKFGGIRYDLADFGLDPAERRRALRFYTDRFGVPEES